MKLLLAQLKPVLADKEANLQRMEQVVQGAAKDTQVDLAIFPELFLTGYGIRDSVKTMAEPLEGPSINRVQGISNDTGVHIMFGMPELATNVPGLIYNSSVLVHPEGRVESYRKLHLANFGPFLEKQYYSHGSEARTFETSMGTIGPQICDDAFFPELTKIYALKGAEVMINISAGPTTSQAAFETVMPARAFECAVFYIYVNLVGNDKDLVYFGGSMVIGPRGDTKAKAKYLEEDVLTCEIDLDELKTARDFRPTLRDTRPEMFEDVRKLLDKT